MQHFVQIEAGAHGFADVHKRLKLLHLSGEFRTARLEGGEQINRAQCDRGLCGERLEDRHLTLLECLHPVAPQQQHSDDMLVEEQRCTNGRPEAREPLQIEAAVVRIGENVHNLFRLPSETNPTD